MSRDARNCRTPRSRAGGALAGLRIAGAAALLLIAGCAPSQPTLPDEAMLCPLTPPAGCSPINVPVCGYTRQGQGTSYTNACQACADGQVAGYIAGRCPPAGS